MDVQRDGTSEILPDSQKDEDFGAGREYQTIPPFPRCTVCLACATTGGCCTE